MHDRSEKKRVTHCNVEIRWTKNETRTSTSERHDSVMERRCVKRHRPALSEAEIESDLYNCHRECVVKPRATASSPKTDNMAASSVYTQVICPYILARGGEGVREREEPRERWSSERRRIEGIDGKHLIWDTDEREQNFKNRRIQLTKMLALLLYFTMIWPGRCYLSFSLPAMELCHTTLFSEI